MDRSETTYGARILRLGADILRRIPWYPIPLPSDGYG